MNNLSLSQQALEPLRDEHKDVLLLCSRIREGLKRGIEMKRIRKYTDWFQETHLKPHFELGEQLIFPLLGNNVRVKKALANHRRIKRLLSCSCKDEKVLNLLEEELTTHIRFEERILYKELELSNPGRISEIEEQHKVMQAHEREWKDPFWF